MSLLLLIRHGITDLTGKRLIGWTPGVHLSERGRQQASDLVERLAPIRIDALYSSPLERCRETAAPLAAARSLRVSVRRELGEVRYGDWQGRPFSQLVRTKLWKVVHQQPSAVRFPGGESLIETQHRGVRQMERILADHPGRTVAVISHGDMIRLLIAHFAGVHIDLYQRFAVETASVSAVALTGDRGSHILKLNDTGSLTDLAGTGRQ